MTPQDQQLIGLESLLREAREIVGRVAAQASLPTPEVALARPVDKLRSPRANARFKTLHGVPTIKVTEAALRELPYGVLEFLLTHELGHLASEEWWTQRFRRFAAGFALGALLMFGGITAGGIAQSASTNTIAAGVTTAIGAVIAAGSWLLLRANSRTDELRADAFAACQHGNLSSAHGLFEVWDRQAPEREWSRGLRLPLRGHPYRATRLEAIEAEISRQDPSATRRTR